MIVFQVTLDNVGYFFWQFLLVSMHILLVPYFSGSAETDVFYEVGNWTVFWWQAVSGMSVPEIAIIA